MASFLAAWRERSTWRRTRLEGRHLVKESRRILKRKGRELPEDVAGPIRTAIADVETALQGHDNEQARKAIAILDERMDQNLAASRKSTLREYSESIGVAIAIALILRAFVVEAFQIPSGSMIPTLEVGDHIFVSKFAYGLGIPFTNLKVLELKQPERGDVIVFKYPLELSTDYIKRVVGLPGDVVEVRQHEVFINGHPMPHHRVPVPCPSSESTHPGSSNDDHDCEEWEETLGAKTHSTLQEPGRGHDFGRTVVPEGNVFVMGDNRDNSSDSRVWGTVRHDYIKGKALIVWWSRAPTEGWNIVEWFKSIRWNRFFQIVR
jgi:signal peptidase I